MGRHSKDEPPDVSEAIAARISTGTATGYHRVPGQPQRRGIAKWLIASLVAVVLLGVGGFFLMWGNDVLNRKAEAEANGCAEGRRVLRVVVPPRIDGPIGEAAKRWNDSNKVVHSHCVIVEVGVAESRDVLKDLRQKGTVRAVPAVWIPELSHLADQLAKTNPERLAGAAMPLVEGGRSANYPFVVVGGAGVDDVQERAAQHFRQFLLKPAQLSLLTPSS